MAYQERGTWRHGQQRPPEEPRSPVEKASWRKKGNQSPAPRKASTWWSRHHQQDVRRPIYYRRIRLGFFALIFAGLVTAFVIAILQHYPATALTSMIITSYESNLIPPNALAMEDAKYFGANFPRAESIRDRKSVTFSGDWRRDPTRDNYWSHLSKQLDEIRPGGPNKDVILVYVSAHGVLDEQGRPCLLLYDANPLDSSTWLPLQELLEKLQTIAGGDQSVKKILLLDASRIQHDWSLGLLYNGFSDALAIAVEQVGDRSLVVINSASPGQQGWPAPELQGSVFGHFVAAGLRGYADANGDGTISLAEFSTYLEKKVSSWVREHRDASQHPLLIAHSSIEPQPWQVAFASVSPRHAAPSDDRRLATAQQTVERHAAELQHLWRRVAALNASHAASLNPLDWAKLQWIMSRMEKLLLAGRAYEREFGFKREESLVLLNTFEQLHRLREDDVFSLPLVEQLSLQMESADRRKTYLREWDDPKTRAAWPRQLNYSTAAAVVWDWLKQQEPNVDRLREALQLVEKSTKQPRSDTVEIHTLQMLYRHLSDPAAIARAGKAVQARDLAERAAAPADERAHYWIQRLVQQGDGLRRTAEDKLFIETSEQLEEAERVWRQLLASGVSPYQQSLTLAEQVTRAYRLRDQAYSNIVHLANWILTTSRHAPSDQEYLVPLYELIEATHRLAVLLDEGATQGEPDWAGVEGQYQQVQNKLRQLEDAYHDQLSELYSAGTDQHTLRDVAALLSVPVFGQASQESWAMREELRKRYLDRVFSYSGSDRLTSDENAQDVQQRKQQDLTSSDAYLDLLGQRVPHPVLALLDTEALQCEEQIPPAPAFPPVQADQRLRRERQIALLSKQGGELRRILLQVGPACKELTDDGERRLHAADTVGEVRWRFSRADRLARAAAAPLAGERPWFSAAQDPTLLLRQLDRHANFMWHAQRALEDFWGPKENGGEPFFLIAARGYQRAAQRLVRRDDEQLKKLFEERQAAAAPENGLRPEAQEVKFLESQPLVDHQVEFGKSSGLPSGTATFFLRPFGRPGQRLEVVPPDAAGGQAVRSFGIPLGQDPPAPVRYSINKAGFENTTMLQAVTLFRGHIRSDDFAVTPSAPGNEVLALHQPPTTPIVTVSGEDKNPSVVLFIFDCSGSMSKKMQGERRPNLRPPEVPRMDVARQGLFKILDRLPDGKYRVGLMLYGHRASDKVRGLGNRPGAPPTLHPNLDVQMVIPPERLLDENLRAEIKSELNAVRPWGQTPLYLALSQGLRAFDNVRNASSKHIVLITDGVNDVLASGPSTPIANDVMKLLEQPRYHDIRVDIVGLDMATARGENPSEIRDLTRIAQAGGGQYDDTAKDPSSLIRALEAALESVKFVVHRATDPAPSDALSLGSSWYVDTWAGPDRYQVRLAGTDRAVRPHEVLLEGGEALEIHFDRNKNLLVHSRYEPAHRQPVRAACTDEDRYYVSAFMPTRRGKEVTFYVSLQNAKEWQFSPRPKRIWCEITPTDFDVPPTSIPAYHFYDLEFQEGMPVPVVVFKVPNWPEHARQATINIWFAPEDVPGRAVDVRQAGKQWFTVEGVPGVEFQVEQESPVGGVRRLVVTQRQIGGGDNDRLYGVRLQASPLPDRITHRYIVDVGQVVHEFYYTGVTSPERLIITPREQVTEGAVTLLRPLQVIPED